MSRPDTEAVHSAGGVDYFVMPELAVIDEQRHAAAGIFPSDWFPGPEDYERDPIKAAIRAAEIAENGYVQVKPIGRALAYAGELLVAQGSVVNITPQESESAEPDLSILGLAEGVVHEDWQRKGIGRVVMGLRVEYAQQLGAEVIMAASDKTAVRKVLMRDHGFRDDNYYEFFYRKAKYEETSNPSWLVWRRGPDVVNTLPDLLHLLTRREITSDF